MSNLKKMDSTVVSNPGCFMRFLKIYFVVEMPGVQTFCCSNLAAEKGSSDPTAFSISAFVFIFRRQYFIIL